MRIPVHSPWLPGYMNVVQTVLVSLTMAGLLPGRPHMCVESHYYVYCVRVCVKSYYTCVYVGICRGTWEDVYVYCVCGKKYYNIQVCVLAYVEVCGKTLLCVLCVSVHVHT